MDPTAQAAGGQTPPVPSSQPTQKNGPTVQQPARPSLPPVQPISSGHPEMDPGGQPKAEPVAVQTVEHTPVLELKKEILPGVEEVHHESEPITLPSQIQDAGVSSIPIPLEAMTYKPPAMVLPLSQIQMKQGLSKPLRSSFRWLAEWCVKQLKEAHLGMKRKTKNAKRKTTT